MTEQYPEQEPLDMYKSLVLLGLVPLGLAGACGRVEVPDEPITSGSAAALTTSTSVTSAPQPSGGPSSTTSATPSPSTLRLPLTTTTLRLPPTTAARPVTTATTRPLSRAEATSRLCAGVASADEAIQRGSFVSGGLRLSSALGANQAVADPQVVTAARAMLRAGLNADPEGYVTARRVASDACSQAGFPINLGGPIQCIQAPCP